MYVRMKSFCVLVTASLICASVSQIATAQTNAVPSLSSLSPLSVSNLFSKSFFDTAPTNTTMSSAVSTASGASSQTPALRKVLSNKSVFGISPVLTLGGNYVTTPKEDYEMTGVCNQPLTLDEMHGVLAEIGFGDATKKGEWQLRYRQKLMTMDTAWQTATDAARGFSLSDRRSQVLKASYNLRDWWQVGVSALVEDRIGAETGVQPIPMGVHNGESLGFQIDTSFRF